jgi:egghead protein (zeste-white 4 protein)
MVGIPCLTRRQDWRPGWLSYCVAYSILLLAASWFHVATARPGPMGWYVTVVWTIPLIVTIQGLIGAVTAFRQRTHGLADLEPMPVDELLIVLVPTIARENTYAALERVVQSFCTCLPRYFRNFRIDVIVDEGAEAEDKVAELASLNSAVRIVAVPRYYSTPKGTRFKARANHYAHMKRLKEGEARRDVWLLHMDDDTGVGSDTVESLALFIDQQKSNADGGLHLGQGVLAFPREYARNRLVWLADSVRPGCDISVFAASTGTGTPRAGLHGELLLVRASIEAEIGWDFGPMTLVEDAHFALSFCAAYPGRSGWFPGLSYGASPATVSDFLKQRERWVWGLLQLITHTSVPLRARSLLAVNIAIWACAPAANPGFLLLVGLALGDTDTTPPSTTVVILWTLNLSFYVWLYWEGLKINAVASSDSGRRWWEPVALIVLGPVFAIGECVGIVMGLFRFLIGSDAHFTVIAKTT